jgi:hypothetical protein
MAGQDDFVKEAKAQLDKWNAEFTKMQAEAEKMTADAQAQFKTQMDAMEGSVSRPWSSWKRWARRTWRHGRTCSPSFQNAWKAMEKGMEDVRKRYMK